LASHASSSMLAGAPPCQPSRVVLHPPVFVHRRASNPRGARRPRRPRRAPALEQYLKASARCLAGLRRLCLSGPPQLRPVEGPVADECADRALVFQGKGRAGACASCPPRASRAAPGGRRARADGRGHLEHHRVARVERARPSAIAAPGADPSIDRGRAAARLARGNRPATPGRLQALAQNGASRPAMQDSAKSQRQDRDGGRGRRAKEAMARRRDAHGARPASAPTCAKALRSGSGADAVRGVLQQRYNPVNLDPRPAKPPRPAKGRPGAGGRGSRLISPPTAGCRREPQLVVRAAAQPSWLEYHVGRRHRGGPDGARRHAAARVDGPGHRPSRHDARGAARLRERRGGPRPKPATPAATALMSTALPMTFATSERRRQAQGGAVGAALRRRGPPC